MSANYKITMVALMSSTALSISAPVVAQDANEAVLEEIVVTATRRATSVQDIPYNISAVSGASIERAQMQDAAELLRSMAGVAVADTGMRNAGVVSTIKIRGLNVDTGGRADYAVMAAPTVASYINDTPLHVGMMLKDLERVEVLRGPQGTLYGAGSLGGAVRYITNKPDLKEFSGSVKGSASTTKASGGISWTGDVVLNVPLSEQFAVRLVGSRVDNAGIIDYRNVYETDASGAPVAPDGILTPTATYNIVKDADFGKSWFFRGTALFEPNDTFNITMSYTRQSDETGGRRATSAGHDDGWGNPYGDYELGSVQVESSEADVEMFAAEINVDLGFATLTSSTSKFKTSGNSISENTGYYSQQGWWAWYYNPARPLAVPARSYGNEAFVQEARLVSNGEGPLSWIAGVYYQDHDNIAAQQSYMYGALDHALALYGGTFPVWLDWVNADSGDQDWDYNSLTTSKELAFYGEVTYDVSEQFHVTAGARWFDSEVTTDADMIFPWFVSGGAVANATEKNKDVLFKVNLSYDVTDDAMVFGTFSQGYRRGGANAVPVPVLADGGPWYGEDDAWFKYGADSVDNFEIGAKGKTDAFSYTVSAFYVDWSDPQLNTASPNGGFFVVGNSGGVGNKYDVAPNKATTKGFEVELIGELADNLRATVGYAYVDAKLDGDMYGQDGFVDAPDGNKLPGVPQHMFNVALDYQTAVTDNIMFYGRLDGYLQSEVENSVNVTGVSIYGETLPSFSLWNVNGTFAWENVDVSIFVKNVFNNKGITGVRSEGWGGTLPSVNYYGSGANHDIALPRTIGVALKYNF